VLVYIEEAAVVAYIEAKQTQGKKISRHGS